MWMTMAHAYVHVYAIYGSLSEKHFIYTYVEDAILQLLEHKEENPKVNVTKFFSD